MHSRAGISPPLDSVCSLFIDPIESQIVASKRAGADMIELHTGAFAHAATDIRVRNELDQLIAATRCAQDLSIVVNAGHGLTYQNVKPIARIKGIHELNIGHSIVARAVFVGLDRAVKEMKALIQ